jgi:putative two-component system response regulator
MVDIKDTILIVDDEDGVRYILKHKLTELGYQCFECANATRAIEILNRTEVGLVLLDMRMPGKTGMDILPEIKTRFPQTSVIMATAVSEVNIVIECMKQGAYDYLTKPFNLTEVAMSVKRAFEKRRLEITLKDYHEHLQQKVEEQSKKIRNTFLNAITSLAFALDAKDSYTNGHSIRVAECSVNLAKRLNLATEQIEKIRIAGLIHDIGKIGIPETILNKPGRLTDDEFKRIQVHCVIGERIIQPIVDDPEVVSIVRHHHERYDGRGYPDGLAGIQIPIGARIMAVTDSYDAMTSDRSYRRGMDVHSAIKEIQRNAGSQFDIEIAQVFYEIISESLVMV